MVDEGAWHGVGCLFEWLFCSNIVCGATLPVYTDTHVAPLSPQVATSMGASYPDFMDHPRLPPCSKMYISLERLATQKSYWEMHMRMKMRKCTQKSTKWLNEFPNEFQEIIT